MRIKEMIASLRSSWFLNKFSLSALLEVYREQYGELTHSDDRVILIIIPNPRADKCFSYFNNSGIIDVMNQYGICLAAQNNKKWWVAVNFALIFPHLVKN